MQGAARRPNKGIGRGMLPWRPIEYLREPAWWFRGTKWVYKRGEEGCERYVLFATDS